MADPDAGTYCTDQPCDQCGAPRGECCGHCPHSRALRELED